MAMASILEIPIVAYGQNVTDLQFAIGSTVEFHINIEDPKTRLPVDLTDANVKFSLCYLDIKGNPVLPAIFARQANIIAPAVDGNIVVPIAVSDTIPSGVPLKPGVYGFDLWITDIDGNRLQQILFGTISLTPTCDLPGSPITPLPSQDPLAQGPQGPPGEGAISFRRTIAQPADGADFMVDLPVELLNDSYYVVGSVENAAFDVTLRCPNTAPGDRTVSQFRCITSAPLDDGDTLNFVVGDGGVPSQNGLPDLLPFLVPNPAVLIRSVVYLSAANTVDLASASSVATAPAVGIAYIAPVGGTGLVILEGELSGFTGLIPGATYYLSTSPGFITNIAPSGIGQVVQKIGFAKDVNTLIVEIDRDFTIL